MRSIIKMRTEVEEVERDAPGFFLYGLQKDAIIKNWKPLDQVAYIVRRTFTASKYPNYEFYHIGVPDVDNERGEVANIDRLPGSKIKGGKAIFQGGDIIFARIEPSIYNKKTAIVPDVGECLGSTEFLVARPKEGTKPEYLLWALRSQWVQEQIWGKMTGSTGRRRFESIDFAKLQIPWVDFEDQEYIVKVLVSARSKYRRLMKMAMEALQEGDQLALEILESNNEATSLISSNEFDEEIIQDKWANMEKLYLPRPHDNGQLTLDLDTDQILLEDEEVTVTEK
jgi:hypothetical protein